MRTRDFVANAHRMNRPVEDGLCCYVIEVLDGAGRSLSPRRFLGSSSRKHPMLPFVQRAEKIARSKGLLAENGRTRLVKLAEVTL